FIRQVGLDRLSTHLVNNPDRQATVLRAKITLAHLLELGQQLADEQTRLVRSQLAHAYLTGATSPTPSSAVEMPTGASTANPLSHRQSVDLDAALVPAHWPSHVSLPDIQRLLEQGLRQGGRLSLEVASPREKAGNVWRSWPWSQSPDNAERAVASILDCIQANPHSFVRLIGYNPQTQTRLFQEIIVRSP
ncbi:MAG: ribulose bisphosphate carboxylase small subunit, partial [Thermosynechococcaceae cyanobacterium]